MKARSKPTEKRERSVFSTIFISVLVILAVEVTLLIGSIAVSRVPQQLDRNAEDILAKQVENRSSYLEDFLVQAQNLGDMPNRINEKTEALLTSGQISKDTLGQSSASSEPLLEAIADDLVTQLRSSSVTGVFVVLNTCDLDARKTNGRLPGIYLRDLDPDAAASERNEDLMLSFAPAGIVKSMRITTDSCWQPALDYEELDDFVYQPFMTAYQDGAVRPLDDLAVCFAGRQAGGNRVRAAAHPAGRHGVRRCRRGAAVQLSGGAAAADRTAE